MRINAFVGALSVVILGAMSSSATAAEFNGRLSYHWGPKHASSAYAERFAKEVNARSKGRIEIKTFPAGQLFGIRQVLGAVASGSVEIGMAIGIVSFPPLDKNYNVTAMPNLFPDFATMRGFFSDSPEGRALWERITSKAGIEVVGYNPVGPTALFSSLPKIDTVASLEGAKARALVKSDRPRWEALKVSKIVSLPTGEVYTALQNGLIDTLASVPTAILTYNWNQYLKSAQLPYYSLNDAYIIVNKGWFDALPAELRTIVKAVGAEISTTSTDEIMSSSEQALKTFVAQGGRVDTLSPAEQAKLAKLTEQEIEPKMADQFDASILKAAKAYIARVKKN